jgi:hypothetical protein
MRFAPPSCAKIDAAEYALACPSPKISTASPRLSPVAKWRAYSGLRRDGRQVVQLAHQVAVGDQRRAEARVARVRLTHIRVEHIAAILLGGRTAGGVAEHRRAGRLLHLRQVDRRREALDLLRVIRCRRRVADGADAPLRPICREARPLRAGADKYPRVAHIGLNHARPDALWDAGRHGVVGGGQERLLVVLQVGLHGERKLARVRQALRLPRPLARLRKDRKQDRRQYRDNRNYDEQFDKGEAPDVSHSTIFGGHEPAGVPLNRRCRTGLRTSRAFCVACACSAGHSSTHRRRSVAGDAPSGAEVASAQAVRACRQAARLALNSEFPAHVAR